MKSFPTLRPDNLLGYRQCVGIALFNRAGQIFVAQRSDIDGAWQLPQGGIEDGETTAVAARRELLEETGIREIKMLAVTTEWLRYDYPLYVINQQAPERRYRGQEMKWVAMRYMGFDQDINLLRTHEKTFSAWRWTSLTSIPGLIVPFKRPVYKAVVDAFQAFTKPTT